MFNIVNSEMPCVTFLALYILSFHVLHINSRTSTYWKLSDDGKIEASSVHLAGGEFPSPSGEAGLDEDEIFNIITSTVRYGTMWSKHENEAACVDCQQTSAVPTVETPSLVKYVLFPEIFILFE
jgi:hypothetical protein